MRTKPNRPISEIEIAVIRQALEHAATAPEAKALLTTLPTLRVVDQCQCGCPSVTFHKDSPEHPHIVADGLGVPAGGGQVGVIIWGVKDAVTGLEIYDGSASASTLSLADLKSVVSWESGASFLKEGGGP